MVRWVRTMPAVFLLLGLSFGTWLSRLPAVRDRLDASTLEMSIYGLCLAAGSVIGLIVSGRTVQRLGTKRALVVMGLGQVVALPAAVTIILSGAIPLGLAVLFLYGFAFATADVAMNVSGANAERAFGRARMPLMHAGYSVGTVVAMGLGALAEAVGVAPEPHFLVVFGAIGVGLLLLQRAIPRDEQGLRERAERRASGSATADPGQRSTDDRAAHAGSSADAEDAAAPQGSLGAADALDVTGAIPVVESSAGRKPAFTTLTGSIPVVGDGPIVGGSGSPTRPGRSPWRDGRVLLIGLIALAAGVVEGTAADWLPLALVDGRGVANETGAIMLGVFFASIMTVRLIGSWLLNRFGRVPVVRASALLATLGILIVILVPGLPGIVLGTIIWGLGSGLGWPIAISASADRTATATRDVAAVSALGYGSMLVGPMAFGVLGEVIGLLTAFWALLAFTVLIALIAGAARELGSAPSRNR